MLLLLAAAVGAGLMMHWRDDLLQFDDIVPEAGGANRARVVHLLMVVLTVTISFSISDADLPQSPPRAVCIPQA